MRLIDADAITNSNELATKIISLNLTPYIEVDDLLDFIDKLPTIEASIVVHGEWVDDTGCLDSVRQYKCSNCGKKPIVNMNYVSILSDFCPNCGADMRKGGK